MQFCVVAMRVYGQRRVFAMLLLGFAAGLPNLMIADTLAAWLREGGVELKSIALFSLATLAYSFKFVWAPLVDRFGLPGLTQILGRRRGWMLGCQIVIAALLFSVAALNPAQNVPLAALLAVCAAFASATQDIVIDAWRIEAAEDRDQGAMAAAYQGGYRVAMIAAGALPLILADVIGWPRAYGVMAGLMALGMAGVLFAPVPQTDVAPATRTFSIKGLVIEPLTSFFARFGVMAVAILAAICLYRLSDFTLTLMNPFYLDLGFSKIEIAEVRKVFGVAASLGGVFIGGLAIARYGVYGPLVLGALGSAISNLMFLWLATRGHDLPALFVTIGVDNLCSGFAGACLIAFMSSLVNREHTATQYALFSSFYSLPGKLLGGASGAIVESSARLAAGGAFIALFPATGGASLITGAAKLGLAPQALLAGYGAFFVYTFALGLPAVALSLWVFFKRDDFGPMS